MEGADALGKSFVEALREGLDSGDESLSQLLPSLLEAVHFVIKQVFLQELLQDRPTVTLLALHCLDLLQFAEDVELGVAGESGDGIGIVYHGYVNC